VSAPPISVPAAPEQFSTRIIFFVAGLAMSAWAPLVPFAKARIGADDKTLGFVLLCLGLGSIAAMPFTAALAARFGCRTMIAGAVAVLCAAIPMLALAPGFALLAASVFAFGAAIGTVDVTINIQAVIVERVSGRAMMSGFHGLFSVGGIAGAGGVSGLLWLGASPVMAAGAVSAVTLVLLLVSQAHLLPYGDAGDARWFAVPRGLVLFVGALCFICFLAEGAMLDWSAVFLTTRRAVDPAMAGLGYAVFAGAMTASRLTGDKIVYAAGPRAVLITGGVCAASGMALAVVAPWWVVSLVGFGLVGIGASNIVPVLYSALGRQSAVPLNVAVAAVTLLGYTGILSGPALIGAIAQATDLSAALLGVAALLLFLAASAPLVTPGPASSRAP
jgi:predicted MFS family arabinose efflux permease